MQSRADSPLPPAGQLSTGLFHVRRNYTRWREHGAPGWLLVYTLEGQGRFGHGRGELVTCKGDLVLIAPRTCNDYGLTDAAGRWDLLWAYFFCRVDWHSLLKWPEESPGLMRLHLPEGASRTRIVRQLTEAHRFNTGPLRQREFFAMNALEQALLWCDAINPRSEQYGMDSRVLAAMNYLCQNLSQPVTIAMLAQHCGLSVSRLAHLFSEQTGQSPREFLELQRMAHARQLLELTDESVSNIATAAGFADAFHFSRRFKHHSGMSPRGYRQQMQHLQ